MNAMWISTAAITLALVASPALAQTQPPRGGTAPQTQQAQPSPGQTAPQPGMGMGMGSGMPGMMGPGMMGQGMMGMGMMGPGMMGHGMMGPGMMGPGMMGPGMMGYGMPMMGPGMMMGGPGMMMGGGMPCPWWGQQAAEVTPETVQRHLEAHLAMSGNDRLKIGEVTKQDDGRIVASIVTRKEGAVVDKFAIDPRTHMRQRVD